MMDFCFANQTKFAFSSLHQGKLERVAVLKAICAGFKETTDPPICRNGGLALHG